MRRLALGTWFVIVVSVIITSLFLSFVYWRVTSPTDGARLEPGNHRVGDAP